MSKNYITKVKNQFKSSAYYMFWGTATFAVVAGQLYVGSGYRQMSKSLDAWFDKTHQHYDTEKTYAGTSKKYESL